MFCYGRDQLVDISVLRDESNDASVVAAERLVLTRSAA
jgi:hypothetical protein